MWSVDSQLQPAVGVILPVGVRTMIAAAVHSLIVVVFAVYPAMEETAVSSPIADSPKPQPPAAAESTNAVTAVTAAVVAGLQTGAAAALETEPSAVADSAVGAMETAVNTWPIQSVTCKLPSDEVRLRRCQHRFRCLDTIACESERAVIQPRLMDWSFHPHQLQLQSPLLLLLR